MMATQIIYNGTVIGTVTAGQSKILKCNGKKMKSDVEIRAGERTEIKYDGAVIATVEAGSSKTIKCAGKTMKSNIEIRVEDDTPGKDGVSPTVEMIDIEGGTRIIITDVNGPKSTDIMDGKDGPKGDKGDPGEKGENGAQGPKGDKGDKGDTGAQGAQGIQGIQGEKGADGAKGDKGDKGDPGADGKDGVDGKNGSDGVGIKSVVQTTTSSLDGGSNVITVTKTDDTTSTFTVKNGREGSDGKDGYTPIKGVDYFDGKNGTSVTVKSVSESTADGGSNVVTFSDGKTLTVKNGSKGSAGKNGEDYVLTEADKAEIAQMCGSDPIPDYWVDELEAKADAIQAAMEKAGRNKSAFLWYTDAHWANGNSKVSPKLLNYLYMHTPMNKVNFGGDIIGDTLLATREEMKYLYEWRKAIKDLPNHHSVLGNHDMFNLDTVDYEDDNYRYAFMLAPEESYDMLMGDGNYYCIDNKVEKTRYLYLAYMTSDHTAMMAQGRFICDAINGVPEGWHIVAIAHRWFQYNSSSTPTTGVIPAYETEILSVFDAYNARTTRAGTNYFVAQDFTNAKGKIEFCIGGHIHSDYDLTSEGGIPIIITTSDTNQNRVPNSTNDSGTIGTITESAVYGIVADYNGSATKITVVGVGRGESRVITENAEPEIGNLFNLERTYVAGTAGEYIYNNLDESKAYTNVTHPSGAFNAKACSVANVSESGVTVTESGAGGVCVAYPLYLPDITKDSYKITFDYSGTGKCRTYYRYAVNGVMSGTHDLLANETAGASGTAEVTIPANTEGYTWLLLFFSTNTGQTKTFENVTLTKV